MEFQNITVTKKERKILDDFSLKIPEGAIMGLVGSDEQAKSCLLAVAGGVCQPESGQVCLDDEPLVWSRKGSNLFELIGYMPREYGFYGLLNVEEYFELFLSLYRINPRYWEGRVDEVLALTELTDYKHAAVHDVPSEYHPLLYLARILLHDPEWLLLDEPFSRIGITERNQMIRILLNLQDMGVSTVIHSQLFPEILDFYTDVSVIEEGHLITSGLIQDVYEVAMKQSPVRMHVIAGLDQALAVLKNNSLVERVIVSDMDVIFQFNGGEVEEAELLSDLVASGTLIQTYMRNHVNIEEIFRGGNA